MFENVKHTLITNIQFAQYGEFRFECHALLISEGCDDWFEHGKKYNELRAFGVSGSQPVFSTRLKGNQLPFKLEPYQSDSAILLSHTGEQKPIFGGAMLVFQDCRYFLQADSDGKPIDVHTQTGDITKIWELLAQKTAEYWHAPYMGWLEWGPPSLRKRQIQRCIELGLPL